MTHGWPNPERPGVPANPTESRWHFLVRKHAPFPEVSSFPVYWACCDQAFEGVANNTDAFNYLGPCLLPAEVAALVEAARREEREACAEMVRVWPVDAAADVYSIWEISERDDEIAAAIRARGAA